MRVERENPWLLNFPPSLSQVLGLEIEDGISDEERGRERVQEKLLVGLLRRRGELGRGSERSGIFGLRGGN